MEAAVEFLWWVVSKVIFMSNLTTVLRLCFVLLCCRWGWGCDNKIQVESVQLGKSLDLNLEVFSFPPRDRVKSDGFGWK